MTSKRELKEVNLTPDFKDEVFPTRVKGYAKYLTGNVDGEVLCYVAMDCLPNSVATILHLHIPEENRTTENIMVIKEMFYNLLHPWCKDNGYRIITVNCLGDDHKTIELFKTFDFHPKLFCMGMMSVKD